MAPKPNAPQPKALQPKAPRPKALQPKAPKRKAGHSKVQQPNAPKFKAPQLAPTFTFPRIILMLVGIAVMGLGIDIVVKSDLGNSPISACPYVASVAIPQISFGTFMLIWQCILVVAQIVILRREFRLIDLLQIPVSVYFGVAIDLFNIPLAALEITSYPMAWVCLICGIAVLALGVTMTVISKTVMNCGEAVVQAVVRKTGIKFGTMKVIFDTTCAVLAVALSFALMGTLVGVREGTIVCALFTGLVVNVYVSLYAKIELWKMKRKGYLARMEEMVG